jgi:Ca-activated chloride channel family protein
MNARRIPGAFAVGLMLAVVAGAARQEAAGGPAKAVEKGKPAVPGGELRILDAQGQAVGACPLKHTDVQADIVGYVGRVTVKQVFHNPTDKKIEAVYVFPLPQDAAVDDMTMQVGERRIVGQIKPREEAREIYEAAKAAGHVASLLDQERPNIFTQSVANIEPGVEVSIEITYVETLKYADGVFEWVFPMVVGPRYVPGGGSAPAPMTPGQDTPEVPDGSKITPPVTPKGTRAGHDISLTVRLDTGMELRDLASTLHEVNVETTGPGRATVMLRNQAEIPNKDFILRYRLAGDEIADAFLVHQDERGRFFTLVLQPPRRVVPEKLVPRELIFVLDSSGSMSGFPIEKAKELMSKLIDTMQPADTFNLITFSGATRILWDQPRPNTPENRAEMQALLASLKGGGGTEMMTAIEAALRPRGLVKVGQVPPLRVVCFMTDGFVGNDMAIIDAIKKYAGTTRVFSFGIGNSVDRFLLDNMAHAGRGEVEYVTLQDQADAAMERFHERVLAPVLTDIAIDWGTLPVADVYPTRIPDLFSAKPIMIHGRLTGPAEGTIVLRGNTGAGAYEEPIQVSWPQAPPDHAALASLWARAKVAELMMQDYAGLQSGQFPEELKKQVTGLGIEFRLMTQFTSFVAVEEMTVTVGGEPVKIAVPVEMPEGVSYEGVFGGDAMVWELRSVLLYAPRMQTGAQLSRARGAAGGRPARPPMAPGMAAAPAERKEVARAGADSLNDEGDVPATQALTTQEIVRAKLAEPLHDLAAKVEKEGQDGTLAIGKLKVAAWRVDVMVFLSDASEKTLEALKKLGFEQTGESKAVKLLVGTIDVRKLEELAALDAVLSVKPVVAP